MHGMGGRGGSGEGAQGGKPITNNGENFEVVSKSSEVSSSAG